MFEGGKAIYNSVGSRFEVETTTVSAARLGLVPHLKANQLIIVCYGSTEYSCTVFAVV